MFVPVQRPARALSQGRPLWAKGFQLDENVEHSRTLTAQRPHAFPPHSAQPVHPNHTHCCVQLTSPSEETTKDACPTGSVCSGRASSPLQNCFSASRPQSPDDTPFMFPLQPFLGVIPSPSANKGQMVTATTTNTSSKYHGRKTEHSEASNN